MSIERIGLSPASPLRWLAYQKTLDNPCTYARRPARRSRACGRAAGPELPRCPNRQAMQSA